MCGSWRKDFDLGIVLPMLFPETLAGDGPVVDSVEAIVRDPFFSAIEVSKFNDPAARKRVAEVLSSSHMTVIYCGGGPCIAGKIDLASSDAPERSSATTFIKGMIDEAYGYKAQAVIVTSGPDPGPAGRDAARRNLIRSLRELLDYAEQTSPGYLLNISVETFDRTIEKRQFIGPTMEARSIIDEASEGRSGLGLTLDLSHLPQVGETLATAVRAAGERLVHAHIGNCVICNTQHPAYGDQHPRFGCEDGENDVPQIVEFLKALGENGCFTRPVPVGRPVVSLEVKPMKGEHPLNLLASSKRAFLEAWAKMD